MVNMTVNVTATLAIDDRDWTSLVSEYHFFTNDIACDILYLDPYIFIGKRACLMLLNICEFLSRRLPAVGSTPPRWTKMYY
jgi:hypothetical protein